MAADRAIGWPPSGDYTVITSAADRAIGWRSYPLLSDNTPSDTSDNAGPPFSDKLPFKGFNPLRVRGLTRHLSIMTAYRVHQVRARLAELEQQIARAEQDGKNLCQAFRQRFPRSPFYLVRYPNRTMTLYRWRRSSHRHWRGQDIPAGLNHPVNLASEGGALLLRLLPESARPHYLKFERQRLDLNLTLSLRHYERQRLQDWLANVSAIGAMSKQGKERGYG